jgi:hypothetical protein
MARAHGDQHAASLGQKTMTHTIQCPECGIVLNVPDSAAGRKLKCPKCATKFSAPKLGPAESAIADSGPASTMFPTRKGPASSGDFDLPTRAGSSGSIELPTSGPKKKKAARTSDFDLPSSPGPLRDAFDLPLLDDIPASKGHAKGGEVADPMALYLDEPKSNRKLKGAEARAKLRRCPSCGGVVGVGMSLCNTCGLDLDTGQRIAPLDVFDDEMPVAPREEMPPLGVLFVGSLAALINLLLAVASLVAYTKGQGTGMLCLMVVWFFGIYASVQFLRRKAIRPLFLAHGLGVGIGVVYLMVLPIWEVTFGTDVVVNNPEVVSTPVNPDDPAAPQLPNLADQLDMNRITWGIALLLSYAALSVYMNTPSMKREFAKR